MTEPDPFEARLRATLDRHADGLAAPPGPVGDIVRRSHRRAVRRRAAGALAGVGSLVLAAGIVTRQADDVAVDVASGAGSTTTAAPDGSTPSVPGTSDTSSTTDSPGTTGLPTDVSTTVPAPTTSLSPPTTVATDGLGPTPGLLVADEAPTGILSSTLRIEVDPPSAVRDGESVKVRGSQFPPGAMVGLIWCSTDGLKATTLSQGAGWCDIVTAQGFSPGGSFVVAADGTFRAPGFVVRRHLSTMGGTYDCALGTADPDEARALREQGLLGPGSYPEGVWGCSVVAVVFDSVPSGYGDGSTALVYREATAEMVTFAR